MKSISILCLLLPFALFLSRSAAHPEKTTANTPTNLIPKACEKSSQRPLCISVLNAEPTAKTADLKGLAFIALKAAINTATNTSTHIHALLEKGSIADPGLEDGLRNCGEFYVDVVDQINNSVDALVRNSFTNVDAWVKAAIADIDSCNSFVKTPTSPKAKAIVDKNRVDQDLCKNALEVVNVFASAKAN